MVKKSNNQLEYDVSGRWNSKQNYMNPALRHRMEVKNDGGQFWSPPRLGYYNTRVGLVVKL